MATIQTHKGTIQGPKLGSWEGLPIIAIGPKGGKIIGHRADGSAIYAGSKEALALAASKAKAEKVKSGTTAAKIVDAVIDWFRALTDGPVVTLDNGHVAVPSELAKQLTHVVEGQPVGAGTVGYTPAQILVLGDHAGQPLLPDLAKIPAMAAAMASGTWGEDAPFYDVGTLADMGPLPGATHGARILADSKGTKYVWKPGPEWTVRAEEAYYRVARLVFPDKFPRAQAATRDGALGLLVAWVDHDSTLAAVPDKALEPYLPELVKHHVLDWMMANHDAHGGNFAVDGDKVIGLDKGQAFKHVGQDVLTLDYQPNEKLGATQRALAAVKSGKIKLGPDEKQAIIDAARETVAKVSENVTSEQLHSIVGPYVEVQGKAKKWLAIKARFDSFATDYAKFLGDVLGEPVDLTPAPTQALDVVTTSGPSGPSGDAVVQLPGWPKKKGKVEIHHPGHAAPASVKWPAGYPGPGFKATVGYKGGLSFEFEFVVDEEKQKPKVKVTLPTGEVHWADGIQSAADVPGLFVKGLKLDLSSSEKKALDIGYSAKKLFKLADFAEDLAQVQGQAKDPVAETVVELEAEGVVSPETPSIPVVEPEAPYESSGPSGPSGAGEDVPAVVLPATIEEVPPVSTLKETTEALPVGSVVTFANIEGPQFVLSTWTKGAHGGWTSDHGFANPNDDFAELVEVSAGPPHDLIITTKTPDGVVQKYGQKYGLGSTTTTSKAPAIGDVVPDIKASLSLPIGTVLAHSETGTAVYTMTAEGPMTMWGFIPTEHSVHAFPLVVASTPSNPGFKGVPATTVSDVDINQLPPGTTISDGSGKTWVQGQDIIPPVTTMTGEVSVDLPDNDPEPEPADNWATISANAAPAPNVVDYADLPPALVEMMAENGLTPDVPKTSYSSTFPPPGLVLGADIPGHGKVWALTVGTGQKQDVILVTQDSDGFLDMHEGESQYHLPGGSLPWNDVVDAFHLDAGAWPPGKSAIDVGAMPPSAATAISVDVGMQDEITGQAKVVMAEVPWGLLSKVPSLVAKIPDLVNYSVKKTGDKTLSVVVHKASTGKINPGVVAKLSEALGIDLSSNYSTDYGLIANALHVPDVPTVKVTVQEALAHGLKVNGEIVVAGEAGAASSAEEWIKAKNLSILHPEAWGSLPIGTKALFGDVVFTKKDWEWWESETGMQYTLDEMVEHAKILAKETAHGYASSGKLTLVVPKGVTWPNSGKAEGATVVVDMDTTLAAFGVEQPDAHATLVEDLLAELGAKDPPPSIPSPPEKEKVKDQEITHWSVAQALPVGTLLTFDYPLPVTYEKTAQYTWKDTENGNPEGDSAMGTLLKHLAHATKGTATITPPADSGWGTATLTQADMQQDVKPTVAEAFKQTTPKAAAPEFASPDYKKVKNKSVVDKAFVAALPKGAKIEITNQTKKTILEKENDEGDSDWPWLDGDGEIHDSSAVSKFLQYVGHQFIGVGSSATITVPEGLGWPESATLTQANMMKDAKPTVAEAFGQASPTPPSLVVVPATMTAKQALNQKLLDSLPPTSKVSLAVQGLHTTATKGPDGSWWGKDKFNGSGEFLAWALSDPTSPFVKKAGESGLPMDDIVALATATVYTPMAKETILAAVAEAVAAKKQAAKPKPKPKPKVDPEKAAKIAALKEWRAAHTLVTSDGPDGPALSYLGQQVGKPVWLATDAEGNIRVGDSETADGSGLEDLKERVGKVLGIHPSAFLIDQTPYGPAIAIVREEAIKPWQKVYEAVPSPDGFERFPEGTTFDEQVVVTATRWDEAKAALSWKSEESLVPDALTATWTPHASDPLTMVARVHSGFGDLDKVKAALADAGVTFTSAMTSTKNNDHFVFFKKDHLAEAAATETKVVPSIPEAYAKAPTHVSRLPKIEGLASIVGPQTQGAEHQDNRGDLAGFDDVVAGAWGHHVRMGLPGVLLRSQVKVRKVKRGGQVFVEVQGDLHPRIPLKNASTLVPMSIMGSSSAGVHDAETGIFDYSNVYHQISAGHGYEASLPGGVSIQVGDPKDENRANRGRMIVTIPEGLDYEQSFRDALAAMLPEELVDAVTVGHGEDPNVERLFKKVSLLAQAEGAHFHLNMQNGTHTPASLSSEDTVDKLLVAAGGNLADVDKAQIIVGGGTQARVVNQFLDEEKFEDTYLSTGITMDWLATHLASGEGIPSRKQGYALGMIKQEGASTKEDWKSGGATGTMTRVTPAHVDTYFCSTGNTSTRVVYHPRVLRRTDYYWHNSDSFGSTDKGTGYSFHNTPTSEMLKPGTAENSNEVCFNGGVDMADVIGVACDSEAARKKLVAEYKEKYQETHGTEAPTTINGKPLSKFFFVYEGYGSQGAVREQIKNLGLLKPGKKAKKAKAT